MKDLLQKLFRKNQLNPVKSSFFRIQEMIGVLILMVISVTIFLTYFQRLVPLQDEVGRLQTRFDTDLRPQVKKLQDEKARKEHEAKILKTALENLESFEDRYLRERQSGQLDLIDEINNKARKNSVQISGGLSISTEKKQLLTKATAEDRVSNRQLEEAVSYPGTEIQFTASGSYANLRKFLKSLENSKQFLILKLLQVSTEGATPTRSAAPSDSISINLVMTAYFRQSKN